MNKLFFYCYLVCVFILLECFTVGCQLCAQSLALQNMYTKKTQYHQAKDYPNAQLWGEKSLAQAQKEFGANSSSYIAYALDLAGLYVDMQLFEKAEKLQLLCLSFYEENFGEKSEYCGTVLLNLGYGYAQMQKYAQAEEALLRAKDIYQTTLGKDHEYYKMVENQLEALYEESKDSLQLIQTYQKKLRSISQEGPEYAILLTNLGSMYAQNEQADSAEVCYLKALKHFEKIKQEKHEEYPAVCLVLGQFYINQKKYKPAQEAFEKRLGHYTKKNLQNTPEYALTLNNLGLALNKQQKAQEALKAYKEALSTYQKINYQDSLLAAYTHQNIASLYQEESLFGEAESSLEKALKIYQNHKIDNSEEYATCQHNLANLYSQLGKYKASEDLYKVSQKLKERLFTKNHREYVASLGGLGDLYQRLAKYAEADQSFAEAKLILENLSMTQTEEYATILNNIAYSQRLQGKYKEAEQNFLKSIQITEKQNGKQSSEYATAINNLGLLYEQMGLYEKAEKNLSEALLIRQKIWGEQHITIAQTLNIMGLLYLSKGQFSKALPILEKGLAIKANIIGENHSDYAHSIVNLGMYYSEIGNLGKAEILFENGLAIYEKTLGKKHPFYANCLINMGLIKMQIGEYEKAILFFLEGAIIQSEALGEMHPQYINTRNFIAIYHQEHGQFEEAESIFRECAEKRKQVLGEQHPDYIASLNNLAYCYYANGLLEKAETQYNYCIEQARKNLGEKHPYYTTYLNNLSLIYFQQKKYKEGVKLAEKVLYQRKELYSKNSSSYIEALLSYIRFLEQTEPNNITLLTQKYTELYQLAIKQIKDVFPNLHENQRERFYVAQKEITEFFSYFAIKNAEKNPQLIAALYDQQILSKGFLLENAQSLRRNVLESNDKALIELYDQWKNQKEYLSKLYNTPKEVLQERDIQLIKIENQVADTERELIQKSQYKNIQVKEDIRSWRDIQKQLKPQEVAIEIVKIAVLDFANNHDSTIYVALIMHPETSQQPDYVILPNAQEMDNKYFTYYLNSIRFRREDKFSYEVYWKPIAEKLPKNTQKIYFVADGIYLQLNPNTFKEPQSKQFLQEKYSMLMPNNSKDILTIGKDNQPKTHQKAYLIGFPNYEKHTPNFTDNPQKIWEKESNKNIVNVDSLRNFMDFENIADLPNTQKEVEVIAQLLTQKGIQTQVFLREEATEEQVKKAYQPYVLHIATHGFFLQSKISTRTYYIQNEETVTIESNDPLRNSGLLMAGVKKNFAQAQGSSLTEEDGVLTASEVSELDLRQTELVVLSACESGVGNVFRGEGVYGLRRSFKIAGAKAILMSLWKVDDAATQKLMELFYQNWIKLNNKQDAFAIAKEQLREKYPEPYFWGAFILIE